MDSNCLPAIAGPLRLPKVLWSIIKEYVAHCEECYIFLVNAPIHFKCNEFKYRYKETQITISYTNSLIHIKRSHLLCYPKSSHTYTADIDLFASYVVHNYKFPFEDENTDMLDTFRKYLIWENEPHVKSHQEARNLLKYLIIKN